LSHTDLKADSSLWTQRIHPEDRARFSAAWQELVEGAPALSLDYRFASSKGKEFIWLRELSTARRSAAGDIEWITSAYFDVTDLKEAPEKMPGDARRESIAGVIAGLIHELQNDLQIVCLGLDLAQTASGASPELQSVLEGTERIQGLTHQLRDYFFPAETKPSKADAGIVLGEVVRQMERALKRQGIRLRTEQQESLPPVRIDLMQLRRALDRLMKFSCALLPQGGELTIGTGLRVVNGRRQVELKITSSSLGALNVDGQDVFKPFLRINGYQVGLDLLIASEIIRRHEGKISFQSDGPSRGGFSILLEAISD
jgi:nitrogen-specific signal transduction histidine kinase